MPTLFDPTQLGDIALKNRIVMAPLTRNRSPHQVPGAIAIDYYRQRASAGLILTEATSVTPMGVGYPDTPGIWSDEQVEGWKHITQAVHAAGGRILLQLWHVGRISHPLLQENGVQPVAPSAIVPENSRSFVILPDGTPSNVAPEMPRALETSEIPGIVAQYRQAAQRAKRAGFDLVEERPNENCFL